MLRHFGSLGLEPAEFCVFLQLLSFRHSGGLEVKLSHKRLADSLGKTERQIVRYLRKLEERGFIKRSKLKPVPGARVMSYQLDEGLKQMANNLYPHIKNKDKLKNVSGG